MDAENAGGRRAGKVHRTGFTGASEEAVVAHPFRGEAFRMRPCDDSAARKTSGLKARATATGFEFGEEGLLAGFSGESETYALLRRIARQGRRSRRHCHGLGASPPRPRQLAFPRRARP